MAGNKRPSTSSLRRYLTSRPYISIAEIRRRFGLDAEAVSHVARNGTSAFVGLPEREATKLQDLWERNEIGVELSVEVHAPVIVGVYPMRLARFVIEGATNGAAKLNGHALPDARVEGGDRPQSPASPPIDPDPVGAPDAGAGPRAEA